MIYNMDSGGLSSIFQTAKTKLIILSSLLGVGTIVYFTKNYIQHGTFLVTHEGPHNKRPVIVGGKRVVINESSQDVSGKQLKSILKKRSRTSSRASSSRISSRRSSRKNSFASNVNSSQRQLSRLSSLSTFDDESVPLATDEDLTKAVEELSKSVYELEEVLGVNNNQPSNQPSDVVEEEVQRLRSLLDIAQDTHHVMSKANEFIAAQQAEEIEVSMVGESCSAYDDLVENIRMMKSQEYESDSEESFLSAAESVEIQFSDDEQYVNVLAFERKLKDLIKKHSSDDFYMLGIEYLTQYGVPVRSVRTDLVKSENDVDFCVKVHCLRMAFQNLLKDKECRRWFVASGKEMLITLLKKSKYDEVSFSKDFDIMIDYCSDIKNWPLIEEELSSRGVCALSFYDIVLDFMVMDSFADLESPPSAVTAAINNRWLSDRFKETALATAVWSVIKGKKSMLQHQDGFFAKFYDISMNLTPLLAWGFLGPVKELNHLCQSFKNSMLGFMCDIFNPQQASYKSVEDLSIDIFRLAKKRKDELLAMIT